MSITVSASGVERNLDGYHDRALSEPVRVIEDDRETVYVISARVHSEMKCAQRDSLASTDLTDDELALVETA